MHTKHRLPENAQLGISSLVAWLWLWFYDNLVGDLSQDTFFVGAGSSLREYANNHTRYKERKKNSIKTINSRKIDIFAQFLLCANTTPGSCTGSTRSTWGRASPSWSPSCKVAKVLAGKTSCRNQCQEMSYKINQETLRVTDEKIIVNLCQKSLDY